MALYDTGTIDNETREQLVKTLESCLPEDGMDLILIDRSQISWASNSETYDRLVESDTSLIEDMISRINDGDEPVVMRVDDGFLLGTHLWTPDFDHGYAFLMLWHVNPESLSQNWPVIEMVLNQMQCVAGLIKVQDAPILL